MNRQNLIYYINKFSEVKDPPFSTEFVGHALRSKYNDKFLYLTGFDFDQNVGGEIR